MDSEDSTSGKRERCLYQPLSGLLIKHKPRKALLSGMCLLPMLRQKAWCVCITKTEKAESEAQRSKPKGALGSESRNARL